ncbi:MAG: hypothetical protein CM1200mP26_05460 [Acidimicrobiales bacterium]|nr:MAG: hypothetical protein CM1200mP26_05460 [Acidimicrobiales bacterium]
MTVVDLTPDFTDVEGRYLSHVDRHGVGWPIRKVDGVHLCREGAELVGSIVPMAILSDAGLSPCRVGRTGHGDPTPVMTWIRVTTLPQSVIHPEQRLSPQRSLGLSTPSGMGTPLDGPSSPLTSEAEGLPQEGQLEQK